MIRFKQNHILLIYLAVMQMIWYSSMATTYYSATSGGYWNNSSTWSTVTYGDATNTGTYPVVGDVVYIGDGYTIIITTSCGASSITVGQGTSGILQFSGAGTFTLTVSGSMLIQDGGKLWYNSNNNRTHNLFISGNFTNNGTVDLYYDSNDRVNITFNSTGNNIVSGTGSWYLNDVTLTKSTSTSYYLDVQSNNFETAIATLNVTYGTYIHNNSGSYTVNGGGSSFTISENAIFKVPAGTLKFASSADFLYLYGALYVNGGSVFAGSTDGNKGVRYNQTGSTIPYLEVSSGSMTVYGGISYMSGAGSDPFGFKMTGGNLLLNCGSNGTSVEPFYVTDVSGSSFNMSDGTITIQSPNSSPGNNCSDFTLCGTNGLVTVTDGMVEFGNSTTASNSVFTFTPYPDVLYPNFKVTGPSSSSVSLVPSKSSIENFKLLSLYIDTLKTFDIRSIQGVNGDSKKMTLTSTFNGTHALLNKGTFTPRTGNVTFEGVEHQFIGGTTTTGFYDFAVNNSQDISLEIPVTISDSLILNSGRIFPSGSNSVTLLAGCMTGIGSPGSYVEGSLVCTVEGTSQVNLNFPIGSDGSYHPLVLSVEHSNSTSVTYTAQMLNTPASSLGLSLPMTLSKVSDVRYYTIFREAVSNLNFAYLQIYYYPDDDVSDPGYLRVAEDNGNTSWVNLGGTGTASGTGTITSNNFTAFNTRFTLANAVGGTNTLPVELTLFEVTSQDDYAYIKWETASEINSDYFTVERSYDNNNFKPVLRIKSKGNSHITQTYTATDRVDQSGTVYYRLLSTDLDGLTSLSDVREVRFSNLKSYCVYPIPSSGQNLHVRFNHDLPPDFELHLADISGRFIRHSYTYNAMKKELLITLDETERTLSGICLMQLTTGSLQLNESIIISK